VNRNQVGNQHTWRLSWPDMVTGGAMDFSDLLAVQMENLSARARVSLAWSGTDDGWTPSGWWLRWWFWIYRLTSNHPSNIGKSLQTLRFKTIYSNYMCSWKVLCFWLIFCYCSMRVKESSFFWLEQDYISVFSHRKIKQLCFYFLGVGDLWNKSKEPMECFLDSTWC
jgi:hypothetical protein